MPNGIKYSTGSESLALKKGNFYIGIGDVEKAPTETTGYWNGITPPSGGYTIYLNKETNGPSIYCPSNNTELISITNQIAGTNYTAATDCLTYFATQTDKLCVYQDYPSNYPYIVLDGLVLNLDAGITSSYPTSGTTWYDINGLNSRNNSILTNGPTFTANNGGGIVFDGTNDYVETGKGFVDFGMANNSYSVEIVYYRNSNNAKDQSLVAVNASGRGTGLHLILRGNCPYFGHYDADTNSGVSTTTGFFHVVFVFNKTANAIGNQLIYINGVLRATGFNKTALNNTNLYTLKICGGGWGNYLGNVYLTRIYNKGLSSTEVTQNFNATKNRFGL